MATYYNGTVVDLKDSLKTDIDVVAANMRQADKDEIMASHGLSPIESLTRAFRCSKPCVTAYYNGVPVAMTGCVPNESANIASVWFLGTDVVNDHKILFARYSTKMLGIYRQTYSTLYNYVDVRNTTAIEWLTWLGAKFEAPEPYGVQQLPFRFFTIGDPLNV